MMKKVSAMLVLASVAASGCSSRPRNFAPVLGAAPASAAAYEADLQACRQEIALRTDRKSGRLGSAAAGAAAGAGAGVAAGAATSGATFATYGGAAAAGAAVIAVVPVFALAGAWGLSKIKKSKKERAIKAAMGECLGRGGYSVASWRVLSKRETKALPDGAPAAQADRTGTPD